MAETDQPLSGEDDSPPIDYAFWDVPGESIRVLYSLQLFHEIDFVVNEGYRKIPHGGIETAGLLFGSVSGTEIRIEAFRPIECEHASGPSLNFSAHDLSNLEMQLETAGKDRTLANLVPVGWFLGHTRGPLELSEAEQKHFERFLPEPLKVTVLVKPERFQPTRFGFLVRRPNGEMPRDALASAVILPLPGRSFKPGQLVPSIPAPNPISVKRPPPEPIMDDEPESIAPPVEEEEIRPPRRSRRMPLLPDEIPGEPSLDSIWKIPPDQEIEETEEAPIPVRSEESRKLARDRARLIEEAYAHPAASTEITPYRSPAIPTLPMDMVRYIPSTYDRAPGYEPAYEEEPPEKSMLSGRSLTALALSALLGCLVGYIAYLQLPSPVIPIDVRPVDQTIVVSWPPEETRNAVYAAIRLNDGAPVPLSAQEKKTGHVSLSASRDFKVEIVARNWIRDSRGIVRYLHSNNSNGLATPLYSPPSP